MTNFTSFSPPRRRSARSRLPPRRNIIPQPTYPQQYPQLPAAAYPQAIRSRPTGYGQGYG